MWFTVSVVMIFFPRVHSLMHYICVTFYRSFFILFVCVCLCVLNCLRICRRRAVLYDCVMRIVSVFVKDLAYLGFVLSLSCIILLLNRTWSVQYLPRRPKQVGNFLNKEAQIIIITYLLHAVESRLRN